MKALAIVQARMGSSRLPGKVLREVSAGKTMLASVIERVRMSSLLDEVMVATTELVEDEAIASACEKLDVPVSRGSVEDVLDRFIQAARPKAPECVVRITADCPLVDAALIDESLEKLGSSNADYVADGPERTYPRGLDVEVIRYACLEQAWHEAKLPYERVHVTPYLYQHPNKFRLAWLAAEKNYHRHRWCVDTSDDLALVTAIFQRLGTRSDYGWRDVLSIVEGDAHLLRMNEHVRQKALEEG